jgi:hypothetical protein
VFSNGERLDSLFNLPIRAVSRSRFRCERERNCERARARAKRARERNERESETGERAKGTNPPRCRTCRRRPFTPSPVSTPSSDVLTQRLPNARARNERVMNRSSASADHFAMKLGVLWSGPSVPARQISWTNRRERLIEPIELCLGVFTSEGIPCQSI